MLLMCRRIYSEVFEGLTGKVNSCGVPVLVKLDTWLLAPESEYQATSKIF